MICTHSVIAAIYSRSAHTTQIPDSISVICTDDTYPDNILIFCIDSRKSDDTLIIRTDRAHKLHTHVKHIHNATKYRPLEIALKDCTEHTSPIIYQEIAPQHGLLQSFFQQNTILQ